MKVLQSFLKHPLTKGTDLDDPKATLLHRQIIESNPFLQQIYSEWYRLLISNLPAPSYVPLLELGSGAGFPAQCMRSVIRSDIMQVDNIDLVCDAQQIPIFDESLSGIFMINVLHHLVDPKLFFLEAGRCLVQGGFIVMIEPWKTTWSQFVYHRLHHEPFDTDTTCWGSSPGKPLANANGAVPWIIFSRDKKIFQYEFPQLHIDKIQPMMPFIYILSGGLSFRNLMPRWSYKFWRMLENWLHPYIDDCGMFAIIVLRKVT